MIRLMAVNPEMRRSGVDIVTTVHPKRHHYMYKRIGLGSVVNT
jgi:hypothetical protein